MDGLLVGVLVVSWVDMVDVLFDGRVDGLRVDGLVGVLVGLLVDALAC